MVTGIIQDLFKRVPQDVMGDDLPAIMNILYKIGEESILRADLLEQIPDLAAAAVESNVLKDVVSEYLIPLVARSVGLPDNAVDRAAQAALFQLIEAGYVSKFDAEIKICPSILALSNLDSTPDANTKAIPLMSKLGPHLGRDITERVFLERFTELCTSPIFFVRKMCADHFGHFCTAIGKEAFEESLVSFLCIVI
ncbi:unnamed protein product [Acanthoscelides obtectus]|uniref:Uncharacterized protein n=1 Tax=Acanthoscelides obtectus TaxID=200917 RepID=A0A9P0KFI0_ACAOB|nr:unnamed protein product [Acanthoscelides obtectus]CAK1647666.1 Serine/threonine-protein phosphatase 4 regulatory subunit 1 [Acanthoscelides obtectus]